MESQLWAIGIKEDSSSLSDLKSRLKELASVSQFKVPKKGLRVGTLDSLMSLSDDLVKLDMLAEGTVMKVFRTLVELKDEDPTINGVKIETYMTKQWEWDEAKFQMKTPLRELSESISSRIGGLEEELKMKVMEVNNLKQQLQGAERKQQGNLMVRGLTDLITEADIFPGGYTETEFMTCVFVVVPKHGYKEWNESYMTMAQYVVPNSAKLITEDMEYGLFRVIVFKKTVDAFKTAAREKRYTIRDFTFEKSKAEDDVQKKDADQAEFARLQGLLTNWCAINFAEAFTMMLHLKAIRIFAESVLRYGLKAAGGGMRPNFKSYIVVPKRGKAEALRKLMAGLYGGSAVMIDGEADADGAVPGAGGEFYPYVSVSIETAPPMV